MVVVSYCRGRPRLVLVNHLEDLSLPRNSATINWPAWHDLVVDRAVKLQHKQTNSSVPHEIWQPDPLGRWLQSGTSSACSFKDVLTVYSHFWRLLLRIESLVVNWEYAIYIQNYGPWTYQYFVWARLAKTRVLWVLPSPVGFTGKTRVLLG